MTQKEYELKCENERLKKENKELKNKNKDLEAQKKHYPTNCRYRASN